MQLKSYQQLALDTLGRFLEESLISSPKDAYDKIIDMERLGGFYTPYYEIKGLENVPYCCIRIPTGGGKTILASNCVKVFKDNYLYDREYPTVLWLVPSNTIRLQTVEALKNYRHPYRQALNDAFGDRVKVFDITEKNNIRTDDLLSNACIIIATVQTLRVTDTEGRKVYDDNENYQDFFEKVCVGGVCSDRLQKTEDGDRVKYSFANMMALCKPLMILDEAQNMITALSEDMQNRIQPSCIVEFTATPQRKSNTIFNVSAMELKKEEMIKLPIILTEYKGWENAVAGAVMNRKTLAKIAEKDRDYIKPIVLFQAQNKDKEINAQFLKNHLIKNERIDPEKIAIVTGEQRELDKVDLFDRNCKIEYVITVQALKEGWDCSFAYIFCSVANISSSKDVEQLLGRVLRMPYARKRSAKELNCAYAHIAESNFAYAAKQLTDKLIDMGFDEQQALESVKPAYTDNSWESGLFGNSPDTFVPAEPVKKDLVIKVSTFVPERIGIENKAIIESVKQEDGTFEIKVKHEHLSEKIEEEIINAIPDKKEAKEKREEIKVFNATTEVKKCPADDRNNHFKIPQFVIYKQGEFEFLENYLDDYFEFDLTDFTKYKPELTFAEFSCEDNTGDTFKIDLTDGKLTYSAGNSEQLNLDFDYDEWDELKLSRWIDYHIDYIWTTMEKKLEFIRQTVNNLIEKRGFTLKQLLVSKFLLVKIIKRKIELYAEMASKEFYQTTLFSSTENKNLSTDADKYGFSYENYFYYPNYYYSGNYKFQKHFYDRIGELEDKGEEFECARIIDSLPEVKYWVRNLAGRKNASFKLKTSTDYFYPDFVVILNDGRILAIEYKGEPYKTNDDSKEKKNLGELWAEKTNGKCLFLMAVKDDNGLDVKAQIKKIIEK